MRLFIFFLLLVILNYGCAKKEEHDGEDTSSSSSTSSTTDNISIYFIYPHDQVMVPDNYKAGAGVTANSISELFPEMINKINTIYSEQGITTGFKVAGHSAVNYSSYSTNDDCSWKVCLHLAIMNAGNQYIHKELQDNLLNFMNSNNADCIIYWRTDNDSNYTSGAAKIGASKDNCMMQLSYLMIIHPVTIAHELGHWHGCEHDHGLDTSIPGTRVEFNLGNSSLIKHFATFMKASYQQIREYVLWRFSDSTISVSESSCSNNGGRGKSTCEFSPNYTAGDNSSHTCLDIVKNSMSKMSNFR